jgi:hypothetical protein
LIPGMILGGPAGMYVPHMYPQYMQQPGGAGGQMAGPAGIYPQGYPGMASPMGMAPGMIPPGPHTDKCPSFCICRLMPRYKEAVVGGAIGWKAVRRGRQQTESVSLYVRLLLFVVFLVR